MVYENRDVSPNPLSLTLFSMHTTHSVDLNVSTTGAAAAEGGADGVVLSRSLVASIGGAEAALGSRLEGGADGADWSPPPPTPSMSASFLASLVSTCATSSVHSRIFWRKYVLWTPNCNFQGHYNYWKEVLYSLWSLDSPPTSLCRSLLPAGRP